MFDRQPALLEYRKAIGGFVSVVALSNRHSKFPQHQPLFDHAEAM